MMMQCPKRGCSLQSLGRGDGRVPPRRVRLTTTTRWRQQEDTPPQLVAFPTLVTKAFHDRELRRPT